MESPLRTLLQERKELKNKEIILVEEHHKELGFYALVFIKPGRSKTCKCKDHQFKSGQYIYRFAYGYLISDKLKWVGAACKHYNYPPSQDDLDRDYIKAHSAAHNQFFEQAETDLEKQFEQAFGAA
jgi:hypothetical protein